MQQDRILGLNNLDQPADQPLPEPLNPPRAGGAGAGGGRAQIEPIANARAGRVLLRPLRQLRQFPLAARYAGQMGRRLPEPDRAARSGPRHEQPDGKATRAEADGALADARRHGHRRRGHHRHGHVLPRRRLLRHPLPCPQQFRPGGQPGATAARADQRPAASRKRKSRSAIGRFPTLASPDGMVRSYYVADGDFHLVATSKTSGGSSSWPRPRARGRWARRGSSAMPAA